MLLYFLLVLPSLCFFVYSTRFKQIQYLLLCGLTSLCFCFPVYAEDEAYTFDSEITEFTYLQNNELKLNQVENNIIQDEIRTQEEISTILSEPLASNPLLASNDNCSSGIDPSDLPFTFLGYSFRPTDNSNTSFVFSSYFVGDPSSVDIQRGSSVVSDRPINYNSEYFASYVYLSQSQSFDEQEFSTIFHFADSGDVVYGPFTATLDGDGNVVETSTFSPGALGNVNFTYIVTQFLSWILESFTAITSWILSDSMAAVYAAIFLVGCCIAMLFRVLRSA